MIRLTQAQLQPIGLDIGTDSIKMMQLETSGSSIAVHAASRQPLPDEARQQAQATPETALAACVHLVRQMLRTTRADGAGSFHGRHVVAALPRHLLHVKNLQLPMIPAAEIASAIQFAARNVFHFDTEQ